MSTAEVLPTDEDLRAWDWVAALRSVERTMTWLARQTGKSQSAVYSYRFGQRRPSTDWLRQVHSLLSREAR